LRARHLLGLDSDLHPVVAANPFVALAFAITPMLGGWLFDKPINLRLGFGIAAIIFGLVLVVG
jgi:drug/metabolite transporter (DMT)-like permease